MASFAFPTDSSQELGGNMDELTDRLIGLQAQGPPVEINTKFGSNPALRVQVVDLFSGEDLGLRLLFWATVSRQVQGIHDQGISWAVGVITEQEQANDPSRTVYVLGMPEDVDTDAISATLDRYEATRTARSQGRTEERPF